MLTAITRAVSPSLAKCELSFIDRKPIDLEKARQQHRAYEQALERLGAKVISLPEEPDLPDSMFVEDTAVVLDETAVICPLGTESRRAESASIPKALEPHRKLAYVKLPGTLEGGDVLRIGRHIFIGSSQRSNPEGIRQFAVIVAPFGYEVVAVPVHGCLHLKSAVTYLGKNTLLANREWFRADRFAGYDWVDIDPSESHAANALLVGDTVLFPASYPKTRARIEERGFRVETIDISELQKAESGLTCSSILFDSNC
jgi:dimethylargininase